MVFSVVGVLKSFFAIVLIFVFLFVGDYSFGVIPGFVVAFVGLVFYRVIFKLRVSQSELIAVGLLFFLLLPYLLRWVMLSSEYDVIFIFCIMAVFFYPVILDAFDLKYVGAFLFGVSLLILLVGIYLRVNNSVSILFGPNILYRIFGFCAAFYFAWKYVSQSAKMGFRDLLIALAVFVFCAYAIVSTQSRGGLLTIVSVFAFSSSLYILSGGIRRSLAYLLVFVLFVFCLFVYIDYAFLESYLGRSIYFDIRNNSEGARIEMYRAFGGFLSGANFLDLFFGVGDIDSIYNRKIGLYPHNLLIEIVVYNGLYLLLVVSGFFVRWVLRSLHILKIRAMLLSFAPILVGSMLSGNLMDHFYLISAPVYFALHKFK